MTTMDTRPADTSPASWKAQREILAEMDPAERVRVAIELSEAVRELQIQGLLSRNPGWERRDAVEWLIQRMVDDRPNGS